MKKLLLLVGALLSLNAAQAQYYLVNHPGANANPGTFNNDGEYPLGTAGAQTGWTVVHDAVSSVIEWSPVTTIPGSFNFKFNNTVVTSWKASTSGVVTFSTGVTAVPPSTPAALPSALIPDNSLCVWGMAPQAADKIAYKMFGTSPNRQLWIQYNSYTTPGTNPAGWTYWSIVLEETTNKIYFVDQKTANGTIALTVGLQINGTTAFQLPASPVVRALAGNGGTPADNSYYEFVYGTQPAYDMEMKVVNIPPRVALSRAPFQITGTVLSKGSVTVNSLNLNYKINNNPVVTAPITNLSIASNNSYKFTHPTTWNPGANGSYSMKVWTSNINGNPDVNHTNDTAYVNVVVEQSPRTVLHEVFTSATCGPCLGGNNNLHGIMRNNPGVAINIKYQQNFPAPNDDPYQTTESINRRGYYGINSIPHMKPDGGINFTSPILWGSTTSAFNANGYSAQLMDQYAAIPATILVDGVYSINPADSTVTATATITPFANVSSSNLVLHSVITERHTVKNIRTNGETEFFDVMKKMMPDVNGMPIPALVSGQAVNYTQSFTMSNANYTVPFTKFAAKPNRPEHIDSLRVVFFVQDKVTKEVFNAGIGKRVAFVLGTPEKANALNLNVYPNPTNGIVNISYTPKAGEKAAVTVYNMLGGKVFDKSLNAGSGQMNVDLSAQAAGFYLLNFQMGDKVITKKVSLVK